MVAIDDRQPQMVAIATTERKSIRVVVIVMAADLLDSDDCPMNITSLE